MSQFIGRDERCALMSIAMTAAMAAGPGYHGQRYAECAVRLLKAAIGEPITLGEAQALLERWTLIGTPLEDSFSQAIFAIRTRRKLLGDPCLGEDAS